MPYASGLLPDWNEAAVKAAPKKKPHLIVVAGGLNDDDTDAVEPDLKCESRDLLQNLQSKLDKLQNEGGKGGLTCYPTCYNEV